VIGRIAQGANGPKHQPQREFSPTALPSKLLPFKLWLETTGPLTTTVKPHHQARAGLDGSFVWQL
jgi:hypothetical protein